MGKKCNGSIQAVALRMGLLDSGGVPVVGASSMVVSDALIKIDYKFNVTAGTKITQDNGSGATCLTFQDDDTIDSVQLDLDLCVYDDDLICLSTGCTPVTIGGQVVGFKLPAIGAKLSRRVSLEAWSLAWSGDAQALSGSTPLYHHWVWPSFGGRLGDAGIANAAGHQPITGRGHGNPNIGNGPANDLPDGVFTTAMGRYVDDAAPPTASCGLIAVAS